MCNKSPNKEGTRKVRAEDEKMTNFLQRIQDFDARLSLPVFQLSLPKPLEFLLSLLGNLNGPPAMQFVAPSIYFVLLNEDPSEQFERLFLAILVTTLFLVLPFLLYLRGNVKMLSHILFPNASFALSPLLGTALSYYKAPTPNASAIGYHAIILYCLSCVVILYLKHWARRLRPCVVYSQCIQKKQFPIIPKILAKHSSFTSFPSGDAMGATAFWGIPLMTLGYPTMALGMTVLTAFGRMYFLAHHLGDTLTGIGICILIHAVLECIEGLPSIGTAEWYHPIVAWMALVVASLARKGDEK